ncbi:MAG: AAA family ATPase [Bacteroidota bacterium]
MKIGLVLGKFLPLHNGHIELINFAASKCDELVVLVCASQKENISGEVRLNWIIETFKNNPNIQPKLIEYNENFLPNTSVSSVEVSKIWSNFLKDILPPINIIFTSEKYGEYLAEFMSCEHIAFDIDRSKIPVSATEIRCNPFKNWEYIPDSVRPYFIKKICILGTESTGKTTLTQKLAQHFKTEFVPEMAREIIEKTEECTLQHLYQIAILHAETINSKIESANKLLFIDTDVNITRSYSRFLFNEELIVEDWIEKANHCDLYLFLEKDSPFVQDGTRLDKSDRDLLQQSHLTELKQRNIKYQLINGGWEEKFSKAVIAVNGFKKNIN